MTFPKKRIPWQALIVTFGFIGYLSRAPGTWASLSAWILGVFMLKSFSSMTLWGAFFLALVLGTTACYRHFKDRPYMKDPQDYVIDEVCGQWLTLCLFSLWQKESLPWLFLAFILFRVFDITKPWPISYVNAFDESLSPALRTCGLMLDDLLAAVIGFEL